MYMFILVLLHNMSKYCGSGCRIRGFSRCSTLPRPLAKPAPARCSRALVCLAGHLRSQIPNPSAQDDSPPLISHGGPCLIVPRRLSVMCKFLQSPPTLHPATVESIFERSFCTAPSSFALSPSPPLPLSHTHSLSLSVSL
jgi:hypothetical protein